MWTCRLACLAVLLAVLLLAPAAQAVFNLELEDLDKPHLAQGGEVPKEVGDASSPVAAADPPAASAAPVTPTAPAEPAAPVGKHAEGSVDKEGVDAAAGGDSVVGGDVKTEEKALTAGSPRIYGCKRLSGGGCPYTASWLVHVNLYKRTGWILHSTKMETASFNVFDKAKYKFQLSDPADYYVHHMSMNEHLLHKRDGFDVARNQSLLMSEAAFQGECLAPDSNADTTYAGAAATAGGGGGRLGSKKRQHLTRGNGEYLGLVPFYGGLPPEVTADFSKVRSIGQGNSLVPPSVKVLQCLATVCSALKYFGHVVVGVARKEDMDLLQETLARTDAHTRHHTHVVFLKMERPSNLPFHLLAWGQQFIRKHNCQTAKPHAAAADKIKSVQDSDTNVYEICDDTAEFLAGQHNGGPVEPQYLMNFRSFPHVLEDTVPVLPLDAPDAATASAAAASRKLSSAAAAAADKDTHKDKSKDRGVGGHNNNKHALRKPIRFVYYTEMDQVLRFDSLQTLQAISTAANSSCFFSGRRREKDKDSSATDYMGQLTSWRECGEYGYGFTFPTDHIVQKDPARRRQRHV